MRDLCEKGYNLYISGNIKESIETFSSLLQQLKNDTSETPEQKLINAYASCMLGILLYDQEEVLPVKSVPYLQKAAQDFYDLGLEREVGYSLPLCGSLMIESDSPSSGLRTLYDAIYRLRHSGAEMKASLLENQVSSVIGNRIIFFLTFSLSQVRSLYARRSLSLLMTLYELGSCFLLLNRLKAARPIIQELYDLYMEHFQDMDMTSNDIKKQRLHLDWILVNALQDAKQAEEIKNEANKLELWLPWFPGNFTSFPKVPSSKIAYEGLPPLVYKGNIHIPFSSIEQANTYGQEAIKILGSYNQSIPKERLQEALDLIEGSIELYKEHNNLHQAAVMSVCLIEALIRRDSEKAIISEHVNFAFKYLTPENDGSILKYLNYMVVRKNITG